jgi:hypothetical protein
MIPHELANGFFSKWAQIHRAIVAGKRPRKKVIIDALRGREAATLSPEIQLYIAELLSGKSQRGRPPKDENWVVFNAARLIRRVDRWERVYRVRYRLADAKNRAYETVGREEAETVGREEAIQAASVRRKYQAAKKLMQSNSVRSVDWKLARILGRK